MPEKSIYKDIAKRTGGDIYMGVVGPVRTGKSTFIKKFMENLVLPNLQNGGQKERARDEIPQSAAGKTVMTSEPKFIPEEAVSVSIEPNLNCNVRLIDCVGYLIPGAAGVTEDGRARMVHTPWQDEEIPFEEAAEIGTRKVISEHSTVGMVVTTDGSFGELPRESYVAAEARVIEELIALKKPFAIILNSASPDGKEARNLALFLEEKYKVPVALVNCLELDAEDIREIFGMVLDEFPVSSVEVAMPEWTAALPEEHPVCTSITESLKICAQNVDRIGGVKEIFAEMAENPNLGGATVEDIDFGTGVVRVSLIPKSDLFYRMVSEMTDLPISGERELMAVLSELALVKKKYDKVEEALHDVSEKGYGIVMPDVEDLHLDEPQIVKQSGGYGVRLHASAQSIHMVRANIETEINPMVGTEQQSEDLVQFMLKEFEEDPISIWKSNMFGKSLYELVNEGLHTKLEHMPEESRTKLSDTLEKIINEGSNGLICILL